MTLRVQTRCVSYNPIADIVKRIILHSNFSAIAFMIDVSSVNKAMLFPLHLHCLLVLDRVSLLLIELMYTCDSRIVFAARD